MAIATILMPLFLAVATAGKAAISDAELLAQAEAAFRGGIEVRDNPEKARRSFGRAARCYEELRRRGSHNADLYRNQGDGYLLAGDLPRAILAYRRGLRLAPADSRLRANLALAREQVAYPGQGELGGRPADDWPPWLPYLPLSVGLWLFLGCYSLGWLGLVRWRMVRRTAPLGIGILAFVLASVMAASLALEEWNERARARNPLVVVAADRVLLRKGNSALYPPRLESPLNRGVEASLQCERGDWLQIELPDGHLGWVPRAAVLIDTA